MSENVWLASAVHESYARFPLSDQKFKVYLFPTNHKVYREKKINTNQINICRTKYEVSQLIYGGHIIISSLKSYFITENGQYHKYPRTRTRQTAIA